MLDLRVSDYGIGFGETKWLMLIVGDLRDVSKLPVLPVQV